MLLIRNHKTRVLLVVLSCVVSCFTSSIGKKSGGKDGPVLTENEINIDSAAGPSSSNSANQNQYRANSAYYYPGASQQPQYQQQQQSPQWNRDSYSDAASEFGYNLDGQAQHTHVQAHAHQPSYAPPSHSYGLSGYDDGYDLDGGFGGIGALAAGLLGLKGLKDLGILALLKAGFLGLVPLFFLLLPALIIIPLLLFLLPIPVVTIPAAGNGRMSPFPGLNLTEWSGKMTTLARSVVESDKCIERISCEMSRISRGSIIDRTIKKMFTRFETQMPGTLKRMARGYMESTGCKRYGCFIMDDFQTKKPF